jgi:hypothetical protein
MKKSTGLIFVVAVALAAFVYFYDLKHTPPSDTAVTDTSKPAFSVNADDIAGLTLERAGMTVVFERRKDDWYITQPIAVRADQSRLAGITSQIASLQTTRTFPATPEQLSSFGLDHPGITLSFTMKNGTKHKLRLGGKDFSGSSIYVLVDDDMKNASLIPDTLLTTSDKSLEDLRDRSVLAIAAFDAGSFDLTNEGGEIAAMKKDEVWNIEKPRATAADTNAVTSLLQAVNSAQITHFVADKVGDKAGGKAGEQASNLAKYGLATPAIRFRATLPNGQSAELQIGRKDAGEYFARDPSRPMIFRVNDVLYKALDEKFSDLRDKQLVHFSENDIKQIDVKNQNGTAQCVKDATGQLVIPAADSKSAAQPCPFTASLEAARAQEVYDTPPAAIASKLAKPAVHVTLTNMDGKKMEIDVSALSGDSVYARSSAGPEVYKLDKQVFDDLNAKTATEATANAPAPANAHP